MQRADRPLLGQSQGTDAERERAPRLSAEVLQGKAAGMLKKAEEVGQLLSYDTPKEPHESPATPSP